MSEFTRFNLAPLLRGGFKLDKTYNSSATSTPQSNKSRVVPKGKVSQAISSPAGNQKQAVVEDPTNSPAVMRQGEDDEKGLRHQL